MDQTYILYRYTLDITNDLDFIIGISVYGIWVWRKVQIQKVKKVHTLHNTDVCDGTMLMLAAGVCAATVP